MERIPGYRSPVFFSLLALLLTPASGQDEPTPAKRSPRYSPHELIVKLKGDSGLDADGAFAAKRSLGSSLDACLAKCRVKDCRPVFRGLAAKMKATGKTEREIYEAQKKRFAKRFSAAKAAAPVPDLNLRKVYVLTLDEGVEPHDAVAALKKDPNVEYAHPNWIGEPAETPNDPKWGDGSWGLQKIGCPEAWDTTTGSRQVVVAVIDTGVDLDHEDLQANLWENQGEIPSNGVDDDNNGYVDDRKGWNFFEQNNNPDDVSGHGTKMAGVLGAVGNNGTGCTGVNWTVSIMPLRDGDWNGCAEMPSFAEAVYYAVDNGAQVINASARWYFETCEAGHRTLIEDAVWYADFNNVTVVASAGNEDEDAAFVIPGSILPVICVAATDSTDRRLSWSNYGTVIDVSAPGTGTMSTKMGNAYDYTGGTSGACAFVSGACALLLAQTPSLSSYQIDRILKETAVDIVQPEGIGDFTGHDIYTGYGRINVATALGVNAPPREPIAWIGSPSGLDFFWIPESGIPVEGIASTTSGDGFRWWNLYLKKGRAPYYTATTLIAQGSSPVYGGQLGIILPSHCPEPDVYSLELDVSTDFGDTYAMATFQYASLPGAFRANAGARPTYNGLKIADCDRNGIGEILWAPYSSEMWLLDERGIVLPGWPVNTGALPNYGTHPAIGNIDDDPDLEIVTPRRNFIDAYNPDGTRVLGFPVSINQHFPGAYSFCRPGQSALLADVDRDGKKDVIVSYECYFSKSGGRRVYQSAVFLFVNGGRTLRSGWPIRFSMTVDTNSGNGRYYWSSGELAHTAPAVGDLDGDGDLEIVYATNYATSSYGNVYEGYYNIWWSRAHAWHHDGTPVTGWPVEGTTAGAKITGGGAPTLGDTDGDGRPEIVLPRGYRIDDPAWILAPTGSVLHPGHSAGLAALPQSTVTFGRFAGSTGYASGFGTFNGPLVPSFGVHLPGATPSRYPFTFREPSPGTWPSWYDSEFALYYTAAYAEYPFADLTGDGSNEVAANELHYVHVLTSNSSALEDIGGFPVSNPDGVMLTTPAVGDLDGDGRNDLAIVSASGLFQVVHTSGIGTPDWPCWGGDLGNTRCERRLKKTARIVVTPGFAGVELGRTQQFSAAAFDAFGDPVSTPFTWSASAGSINATGLFTPPFASGHCTITASTSGLSGTATADVSFTGSINVEPSLMELAPGCSQQFTSRVVNGFGEPLSVALNWSSSGGMISSTGYYIAPIAKGSYVVFASFGTFQGMGYVDVPLSIVRAYAHDTSRRGAGVQAGDRMVIFFNGTTNRYAVTQANIDSVLQVAGKTWGSILSAIWNPPYSPSYLWTGGDGLVITFAGSGTTVVPSNFISIPIGTIHAPKSGMNAAIPPPPRGANVSGAFHVWMRGDLNPDGAYDVLDVVAITNFAFRNAVPPAHLVDADATSDGIITISDVVFMTNTVFRSGPIPDQTNFSGSSGSGTSVTTSSSTTTTTSTKTVTAVE